LAIRVFNTVFILIVCGCVPPTKEVIPMGTWREHRQPPIPSAKTNRHELSDTEKDKLFRDFEHWRAARGQVALDASPLVDASEPLDAR
jgi:hypothetical protein